MTEAPLASDILLNPHTPPWPPHQPAPHPNPRTHPTHSSQQPKHLGSLHAPPGPAHLHTPRPLLVKPPTRRVHDVFTMWYYCALLQINHINSPNSREQDMSLPEGGMRVFGSPLTSCAARCVWGVCVCACVCVCVGGQWRLHRLPDSRPLAAASGAPGPESGSNASGAVQPMRCWSAGAVCWM